MRMTIDRFLAVINAAIECLDAYERLARAVPDLAANGADPEAIETLLNKVSLRPNADAIVLLKVEQTLCLRKEDKVKQNREAVQRCRERKHEGKVTRGKRPAKTGPEFYTSEEYDEIVRKVLATDLKAGPPEEPKPAPEPQPLIDATPDRGTDLSF